VDRSLTEGTRRGAPIRMLVAVLSALAVLAVAGIAVAGGAGAQEPPKPTWSMPEQMQPGETGTVTGEGFQPGATVTMTGPGNVLLGEAVADEFGRISMQMTVPPTMVSGPATMTLVGANIAGEVMTLNKSVNIGTLVGASAATPTGMDPQFTG
jgi:hypothetical protein